MCIFPDLFLMHLYTDTTIYRNKSVCLLSFYLNTTILCALFCSLLVFTSKMSWRSYHTSAGSFTSFSFKCYIVFYSTEIPHVNEHTNWFLFFYCYKLCFREHSGTWHFLHIYNNFSRERVRRGIVGSKAFIFNILICATQLPSWSSEPRISYRRCF